MFNKYLMIVTLSLVGFFAIGSLSVHLFDPEFAGKFTMEDNSKLIDKGKVLYAKKGCIACHGKDGNNPIDETYPKIGGQPKEYLNQQIIDIRDGQRMNGGSSLMKASIGRVKDGDAYLIALYLSEI